MYHECLYMTGILSLFQRLLQTPEKDRRNIASEVNELLHVYNISRKTYLVFHGGYITYLSNSLTTIL